MLLKSDFKPVPKAKASFVVQTLEGTSCTTEIPLRRVHVITAILDGAPINVGELISNNIALFATCTKKVVPHLSLICWLCEEDGCDLYANDLSAPMMKPLTDTYLDGFVRDYQEGLLEMQAKEEVGGHPQPQPQPAPKPQ